MQITIRADRDLRQSRQGTAGPEGYGVDIEIPSRSLRIGMYVSRLDRPWEDSPFLFQGFEITSRDEIEQLRELCRIVYVDPERGAEPYDVDSGSPPPPGNRIATAEPVGDGNAFVRDQLGRLTRELPRAVQVVGETRGYVADLLEEVRLGGSVNTRAARERVESIVESVVRTPNALVLLTSLKNKDTYTAQHCVNVSILAVVFGRHLGLPRAELELLGLAGLLHDVGKMRVPLKILNKPGRLSAEELAVMKRHPDLGRDILAQSSDLPAAVLDAAQFHHERSDGNGYPHGLTGDQISRLTMIVAIVDFYDAVTSDRVYHAGMAPHHALDMMYRRAPKAFDRDLFAEFMRCLGIYPVGSVVRLDTNEVGVVTTADPRRHLRPVVLLLLDPAQKPYNRPRYLNLANPIGGRTIRIASVIDPRDYPAHLTRVLQGEAALT